MGSGGHHRAGSGSFADWPMEQRSALFHQMSPIIRGETATVPVGGKLFEAIKAQKTNRTTL